MKLYQDLFFAVMMTPIAGGDEQHFQSLLTWQDYIPAVRLDLTEQEGGKRQQGP